jgi:hypothetical protein
MDWKHAQDCSNIISYNCDFYTVDSFLESRQLPAPDFIKIDVEGAELLVLKGASRWLAEGHRPVMLIELFAPWEKAFGYGPWDVLSLLNGLGYRFFFACPNGLVEHGASQSAPFPSEYENGDYIIAFISEKHDEIKRNLDGLRAGDGRRVLPMAPPPFPNRVS